LSDHDWDLIFGVAWLPDGRLLIHGAPKTEGQPSEPQLWLIAQGRTPERLTNDLNSYLGLSATTTGEMLATVELRRLANLWVAPSGDATRATQVGPATDINEIRWTPDGRLLNTTWIGTRQDLVVINLDGTGARQLTNQGGSRRAQMTADGRYIVFISGRAGPEHVWRMDADGTNERALTNGSREWSLGLSSDGRSVFYCGVDAEGHQGIWQVAIDGGEPTQLTHGVDAYYIAGVTPDGLVAYEYANPQDNYAITIGFAGPAGANTTKPSGLPRTAKGLTSRVSADGRAIMFLDRRDPANIWSLPISGGEAKPLTTFKDQRMFSFDWSKDGKRLAVVRGTEISDAVLMNTGQ